MLPIKLLPFKRQTWKPITMDGDSSPTATKFSGTPWLAVNETWPTCPNCGKPMQLFLQLNLDELPTALQGEYGEGLLQLFYCTSEDPACEVDCKAFFPFAKSELIRLVQPSTELAEITVPEIESRFPPKQVTGWEEAEDYPDPYEAEELGVVLEDKEWEDLEALLVPLVGDKLAGWPAWMQGVEYPVCPKCGEQMRLVFQIESDENLPYEFGDFGTGHITQCARHKEILAFGWTCG